MAKISKDTEDLVVIDYLNPHIQIVEICNKYKISRGYVRIIAIRNNLSTIKPIEVRKRKSKFKINEDYFEDINCEDKAYWLGFIAADFHIGANPKNSSLYLSVDLKSTDVIILERFKKCLEAEQKITIVARIDKRTNKSYEKCSLKICNQKICNDIIKHGITRNKSKELSIPNISSNLIKHFIRGYADGDGSFYVSENNLRFSLISSTESIIKEIHDHLKINCNLNDPKINTIKNTAYNIIYSGNQQVKKIFNYLYKDCNLCLQRKYDVVMNHLLSKNLQ